MDKYDIKTRIEEALSLAFFKNEAGKVKTVKCRVYQVRVNGYSRCRLRWDAVEASYGGTMSIERRPREWEFEKEYLLVL